MPLETALETPLSQLLALRSHAMWRGGCDVAGETYQDGEFLKCLRRIKQRNPQTKGAGEGEE